VERPGDREIILRHTVVASPRLCPEIRMRLITPQCSLWKASEEEAASAGLVEPYWAFPWAGGQVLARYLLDEPSAVAGKRVLDFGAGGAVEGIAAALAGARVTVADIDPMAVSAALINAELNGVALEATTEDFLGRPVSAPFRDEMTARVSEAFGPWDIVLAGDVCYGSEMARAVSRWLAESADAGALVLIGDANRGFLDTESLVTKMRFDAPADNDMDGSFLRPATVYCMNSRFL
jgi:predicted nicotinamide N-methyase